MASGERFSGYAADFGDSSPATMSLAHVQAAELTPNNSVGVMHPPGTIDPQAFLMSRHEPSFTLRTPDLTTLFTHIGFQGGHCWDQTSNFYLQERSDCGTFEAGATHIKLTTEKAFMYLDNLSVELESHEGAMANLIHLPMRFGANPVVGRTAGATLVGGAGFVSAFFLGPVYVSGVEIPGVMSQSWSPQIRFQPTPHSPGAFNTHGSIVQRDAQFVVRCLKIDEFDANVLSGDNIGATWAFYLQKADPTNANTDGRIAPATTQHIKASFTTGRVEVRSTSFDGVEDAATEIIVTPTGTVTFSIASAIP